MPFFENYRTVSGSLCILIICACVGPASHAQDEFDAIFGSIEAEEEVPEVAEEESEVPIEEESQESTEEQIQEPGAGSQEPEESQESVEAGSLEKKSAQEITEPATEGVVIAPVVVDVNAQEDTVEEDVAEEDTVVEERPELVGDAVIYGKVLDGETGQPVERVTVFIDETDFVATSNLAGDYRIEGLPAGVYDIVFSKSGYRSSRIRDFSITAAQSAEANFPLPPLPPETSDEVFDLGEYEVTVEELQDALLAIQALRLDNIGSIDIMSGEDFAKFAASDVADAIVRVPGVSIADGKFAVIRGLSDRYSNTLLNGLPLPSPDPDRQSVQLDIFPSSFLSNLVVSKTFTPNQPGNSASGSINLNSKSFVEERILKLSFGTGFDEAVLDNDFRTFDTQGNNHRFADGAREFRSMPAPDTFIIPILPDDVFLSRTEDFPDLPANDYSISFEYGETIALNDDHKISILLSGSNSRKYRVTEGTFSEFGQTTNSVFTPPFFFSQSPIFAQKENYPNYTEFEDEASLGGIASLGYQLYENHQIALLALFNRVAVQEVAYGEDGTILDSVNNGNRSEIDDITRDELYYNERELNSFQANGSSTFEFGNLFTPEISWGLSHSEASQNEPDYRLHIYYYDDVDDEFSNTPTPNENPNFPPLYRSWREIDEENQAWRIDIAEEEVELLEGWLEIGFEAGYSGSESERGEEDFIAVTGPNSGVIADELEDLFLTSAFSMYGLADAERAVEAFYLTPKVTLFDKLDIIFGGRYEDFSMNTTGNTDLSDQRSLLGAFRNLTQVTDPESVAIASALNLPDSIPADATELVGKLEEKNWYPAIQASLEIVQGLKLKGSYSKTAVRPSFKEYAPVLIVDTDTGDIDGGNPFLQLSEVESFDVRVEYFRDNGDLFAVSAFTKDIQDPIEYIVIDTVGLPVTFAFNNPGGAELQGIEFEFNKSLAFIPYMENFSVGGNYTYIDAEAVVSESERATREASDTLGIIAPETRQLVEQPEFILNLNVSYFYEPLGIRSTLSYNRVSDVLKSVGGRDKYDRIEKENGEYRLTFSKAFENGFKVKFSVKNLFEQDKQTFLADPLTGELQGVERHVLGSRSYSINVSKEF